MIINSITFVLTQIHCIKGKANSVLQVLLTAQLNAQMADLNEVTVEWRWNEQPIPTDDERRFVTRIGKDCVLNIQDVKTEDNGKYTCKVVTPLESESKYCMLFVQGESLM